VHVENKMLKTAKLVASKKTSKSLFLYKFLLLMITTSRVVGQYRKERVAYMQTCSFYNTIVIIYATEYYNTAITIKMI